MGCMLVHAGVGAWNRPVTRRSRTRIRQGPGVMMIIGDGCSHVRESVIGAVSALLTR